MKIEDTKEEFKNWAFYLYCLSFVFVTLFIIAFASGPSSSSGSKATVFEGISILFWVLCYGGGAILSVIYFIKKIFGKKK